MKAFDVWILERLRNALPEGHRTIFCEQIPDKVPEWICLWILEECVSASPG